MTDCAAPRHGGQDEPTLTASQLAQFRGCEPWNECYGDCVESAQYSLDNPDVNDNAAEIEQATAWAATVEWK